MLQAETVMRLTVKSESGEMLMDLDHSDGVVIIRHVKPTLRESLYRWISEGIHDWVGEGENVSPRFSTVEDFAFLENLKDYLEKQFRFKFHLTV